MPATIPGLGVATPLLDLLTNYRRIVANLPAVIEQYPDARVVRNQAGNLSIVVNLDDQVEQVGWIDVRTGDIDLYDEPCPDTGVV